MRPVDHYPALLRTALEEVAPTGGEEEATVVVWTPGPFNSAYFEHAFLARQMGVELVEASDLVVRDAVCHIRTTRGLQRVHAIYRRIDDDFMDPLEFRPDSRARRPGPDARLPRGQRRDRQRRRHRRRRRQGDLPLRAGDDPLLPRRGADPRERPDLPDDRPRAARVGARAARPRWWSSRRASPAARACSSARRATDEEIAAPGGRDQAPAGALDRAGARAALDRPDGRPGRRARAAPRRPAPVRGVRRRHPDRPRRAHARGAARGLDDRQLLARAAAPRTRGCSRRTPRPRRDAAPRCSAGRRRGCRACRSAAAGPPSSSNNSSRCSPGSPTSCTGSAASSRAPSTPSRMLDGVFHADLQGRPDDPAGVRLSLGRAADDRLRRAARDVRPRATRCCGC